MPAALAAGRELPGLVIDLDASIVIAHSEKESAAPTVKGSLLDAALAQVPEAARYGAPILVRADTAGGTKAFVAHLRGLTGGGVTCEFCVGWAVNGREHDAIAAVPKTVWADAIDADGGHRDGAGLAEITGLLPTKVLADYPCGTRVIVRRERPHPGGQLDLIETRDGWRDTAFATDTPIGAGGQLAFLDARHRAPPGSRTASAPRRTPAWSTSHPAASRSTPPGFRW